jgi:FixJ family two-component response regulator
MSLTVHRERTGVSHPPKLVAVLDDDRSALSAAGSLLAALRFKPILFASAEDFLNSGTASTIDCLLLDIHLGAVSGIDIRRQLKISHSMLPVIFITGLDDEAAYRQALEVGCAGFLRKPFQAQVLADAIRSATAS